MACLAHQLLGVAGSRCSGCCPALPGGNEPERKGGFFFPLKCLPVSSSSPPSHCKPSTSLRATHSFSRPRCALSLFSIFLPWSLSPEEVSPVGLQNRPGHPKWMTPAQLNCSKGRCLCSCCWKRSLSNHLCKSD